MIKKVLIALVLVVYVAAVALVAVHYRFPYAPAAKMATAMLARATSFRVAVENPRPLRPFHISAEALSVGLGQSDRTAWFFEATGPIFSLAPWSVFSGRLGGSFNAPGTEGGTVRGRLFVGLGRDHPFTLDLEEIDLPQFGLTNVLFPGTLSGALTGRVSLAADAKRFPTALSGELRLSNGLFKGRLMPSMPAADQRLDEAIAVFRLDSGRIILESMDIRAQDGQVRLSGEITNLASPRLNLSGQAELGPPGRRATKIGFELTGPAANPRYRLVPFASGNRGRDSNPRGR